MKIKEVVLIWSVTHKPKWVTSLFWLVSNINRLSNFLKSSVCPVKFAFHLMESVIGRSVATFLSSIAFVC